MAEDPLRKVKLLVAYTVTAVWALVFVNAVLRPGGDTTLVLTVQTTMMAIVGALFADRWIRKNGRGR